MVDPDLLRSISSAAEELACRDGPLRERLAAAARNWTQRSPGATGGPGLCCSARSRSNPS